jgi:hypothetical protein
MANVTIYASCHDTVLDLPGLKVGVGKEAKKMGAKAEGILTAIRMSTTHSKIAGPDGLTSIKVEEGGDTNYPADWAVALYGPNPIAMEFGHKPSGVFAGTDTESPEGLYILYTAAGYTGRKR